MKAFNALKRFSSLKMSIYTDTRVSVLLTSSAQVLIERRKSNIENQV